MKMAPSLFFLVIGYGEIAEKQHVPVIQGRPDSALCAIVDVDTSKAASLPVPIFATVEEAKDAFPELNAAVISTPPQFSQDYIHRSLEAGLNVFAEKPPGRDHVALVDLEKEAKDKGLTLFTGYHSTVSPSIGPARQWVEEHRPVTNIHIEWKEPANKWHRGQVWVTKAEGFGVLDTVFNALSIVDELIGSDILHSESNILVPRNWGSPIAGHTTMTCGPECRITADYDWNYTKGEIWSIGFIGGDGFLMELRDGGAQMYVDGESTTGESTQDDVLRPEYEELYARFSKLVDSHECDVRPTPLRLINQILESSSVEETDDYSIFG